MKINQKKKKKKKGEKEKGNRIKWFQHHLNAYENIRVICIYNNVHSDRIWLWADLNWVELNWVFCLTNEFEIPSSNTLHIIHRLRICWWGENGLRFHFQYKMNAHTTTAVDVNNIIVSLTRMHQMVEWKKQEIYYIYKKKYLLVKGGAWNIFRDDFFHADSCWFAFIANYPRCVRICVLVDFVFRFCCTRRYIHKTILMCLMFIFGMVSFLL